jgi:hypothetical protein
LLIRRVGSSPAGGFGPLQIPAGDFDVDLATIDPRLVELHRGTPTAKVRIVLGIEGEDRNGWSGSPRPVERS